ncbi:A24 family peptidase [Corynebacterium sp. ES2794-CONJ1]|uniref:prepilin peptidase n=1 Tax=unclassified Corynebacterium TaxID=2624378 RepID=UPI0021697146|nr:MULTISPECIES: A24 family peptidase [unclassified Corynebacterium]MCS4489253.1 A24 family peptidase [Corynebacterium sp. ES2775-CONJ]MCS4491066.1 A24 family peptidase [Corynebacterium sp. ES2715-CONJ3]MCS4531053.1 A24 family peptidase [Corynebacterium sp. ES2730-CONJ]MCU9518420.1 A24 family peptidase [Corynebacterium sp. ES2794-CONJ1]
MMVVVTGFWMAALSYFDIRYHRLPNILTLPALVPAFYLSDLWWPAIVWSGLYAVIAVGARITGQSLAMGLGDVKLAPSLGLIAGSHVLWAIIFAQIFTIALACALKKQRIAHGPAMIAGTVCTYFIWG